MKVLLLPILLASVLIFQLLNASPASKNISTNDEAGLREKYVTIGDNVYYIGAIHNAVLEHFAIQICYDVGMKMVAFETQEEWEQLSDYMNNNGYSGYPYWTGGRKVDDEWKWFGFGTQQDFTYTNWAQGEPNQNDTFEGILVYFYSESGWYDIIRPGNNIRYICENV